MQRLISRKIRLKSVFLHVPALQWIVVEDAPKKSQMVSNFLETSGLTHTHLHQATPQEWKLTDADPRWRKPRGVLQRNSGIRWLRRKFTGVVNPRGVVYFADDDNTYSLELFQEMRDTHKVSVWPVALVGGVLVERPLVGHKGQVSGWLAGWKPDRTFALDMAGFAVNLSLLLNKSDAEFSIKVPRGFQETRFLEQLVMREELEPKADLCTKVYVWHTRTEQPDLKDEERLKRVGKRTDEGIEV
ncbi:Galactosylgalactosylxylosylprotein 3-beta-glucuronosyltransferase 1 [Chionoecetes opilio]|uniref:Galactosylgalactosylxylosylprotein 3-beta-glucuronosyltransferase n=1 Tax=Chionoecetes opilio TaxID=41210 RepID=A0A8J4XZK4_CHIOP|nr:Galactosylgalactosylxylosylprotein 3-beta-glucuronosyltransferase 1 [Chionoecetes opilio]